MKHGENLRMLTHAAGKTEQQILDFSTNSNPLNPPEWLRALISSHISRLAHYPDADCSSRAEAVVEIAGSSGVQPGGLNYFLGEQIKYPLRMDPFRSLHRQGIVAVNLLLETSILCLLLLIGLRVARLNLWSESA
jgi:hypothetical protein